MGIVENLNQGSGTMSCAFGKIALAVARGSDGKSGRLEAKRQLPHLQEGE